ncbi:MAG: carbohydrate-binding domain-containing protein, partial [Treponema sp.]|nr:carbohydrate-binding domain-containing protein [Treponema sp.]
MKKNRNILRGGVFLPVLVMLWMGCANLTADTEGKNNQTISDDPPVVAADPGDRAEDPLTAEGSLVLNSKELNVLGLADPVVIVFSGDAAPSISGGNGATVTAAAGHVAVTLVQAGADIVAQGIGADGSITISGNYDFNLHLNGLGLASASGAAINNNGSGAMKVTLVEGTANRLIDGAGGDQKAAFYSKGDF